jgi:hypothetical protein
MPLTPTHLEAHTGLGDNAGKPLLELHQASSRALLRQQDELLAL